MKVTIHAEGSPKDIAEQLREAADVYAAPNAAPVASAPEAPAPKPGKKTKPAAEVPAPAPEETEEDEFDLGDQESEETEETEDEEVEEPAATLEDVIGAFQKYAKKHSREKAAKILAAFKVKSVRDLKPTQFGEVLAKLG